MIKPSEGVSYAAILKNLKCRVSPKELGVKIGGIQKTRTKGLQVKVKCAAEDRGKPDSAFRDVVGESGLVRHVVPTVKLEILDIGPTAETEEVTEAVRSCRQEETSVGMKVCMTKKPFRRTRKLCCLDFVLMATDFIFIDYNITINVNLVIIIIVIIITDCNMMND